MVKKNINNKCFSLFCILGKLYNFYNINILYYFLVKFDFEFKLWFNSYVKGNRVLDFIGLT